MQHPLTSLGTVYSQIHIVDNSQKLSAYNVNLVNKHCLKLSFNNRILYF